MSEAYTCPTHADVVTIVRGDPSTLTTKLVVARPFRCGNTIGSLTPFKPSQRQTYLTLQVSSSQHIELLNDFQFANHSCNPSARFDLRKMEAVALRDLNAGEEVTIFYPAFEWEMSCPFECWCGYSKCLKQVSGALYIPFETLRDYIIEAHIEEMKARQIEEEGSPKMVEESVTAF